MPDFDELEGEVLGDFDSLQGDTVDLNTGAYTPLGAAAPSNVAEYMGAAGPQMNVGAPAQTFGSKLKEAGTGVLNAAQDFSLGLGQGQLLGESEADTLPKLAGYVLGAATTPRMTGKLGEAARTMNARVSKAINPFAGGHVAAKLEATPEMEAGGRAIQSGVRDVVDQHAATKYFSPQTREQIADVGSGVLQVGAEAVSGVAVPIPGMNLAGRVAKYMPLIGKQFPKLSAFILGAVEAGVTMPVFGVLGAEEGERWETAKALLTKPTWETAAFMLLGGTGAAKANAVARQQKYRQEQAGRVAEFNKHISDAVAAQDAAAKGMNAVDESRVAAIISDAEMTKMANDLEAKAAFDKGEIVGDGPAKPALDFEQNPPPQVRPFDPVNEAYEAAMIPARKAAYDAQKAGEASGAARRSKWLQEAPADELTPRRLDKKWTRLAQLNDLIKSAKSSEERMALKTEVAKLAGGQSVPDWQARRILGQGVKANQTQKESRYLPPALPPERMGLEGALNRSIAEANPFKKDTDRQALVKGPPDFPAHVAVTDAPDAKFGTQAVIEWVSGEGTRLEKFPLNSYEDAKRFRAALDKTGVKAEVSFSERGGEALRQMNDPLLNDLLMFSAKELKEGKGGAAVKNRNAALVVGPRGASVESLSSHKVKAQAAENNGAVLIGTKNGPRWALYRGEDEVTGNMLFIPADEATVGPTITRVESIPQAEVKRYVYKPESWELERHYRDRAMPLSASKLLPVGEAAPSTVIRKKAPWTVTNTEKTRVDMSFPKAQREAAIPAPVAAAVADTALGRAYGFEAGGHQGPIAGAGGTKRANLFLKEPAAAPPSAGGGGGGGKRPPGAPVSPEPVPFPERPPTPHDFSEGVLDPLSGVDKFAKIPLDLLKRWRKLVVGEHLSAPITLQQQVAMSISAKNFDRVRGDLLGAIHGADKSLTLGAEADRELVQVGKGNMPFDQWAAKHLKDRPQAAAALKEVLTSAMQRRDFLHDELVRMGVIHPRDEMFKEGDMQKYFARVSAAFVMPPGKWLDIVRKDKAVWDAAKKFLMKENPDLGAFDVDSLMQSMLNSKDQEGFLFSEPKLASAASHIKARKKMPPELKALYGQDMSGAYGFAETLAAQEVLYHRAKVMEEFAANPEHALHAAPEGVLDNGPGSPYEGWTKMENSRAQYGALANMYVSPALKDALVNLPKMHEWEVGGGIARAIKEVSSWTKMNETALGGPQFYMNNLLGGLQHVMMAGIAPWEMPSLARKANFAAKALLEYKANPYAETPGAKFIRDALRVGGDVAGFGSVEVSSGAADELATTILKSIASDKNSSAIDKMTAAMGVVHAKGKNLRAGIGGMADVIDRIWRLSTFAQLTDGNLARGMEQEVALRSAAQSIARAFPMPDRLGVIPDQMRRYTGMFTPYLTYRSEVLRNYMMIPGTLARDPRARINMAAWGIALYGAYKLWNAYDPTPEELLKKERARMPANVERYRPAMISAHWTGKDGRPVFYDMTPVFEPFRYLQGPPEHPVLNAGVGLLSSLYEGGGVSDRMSQMAGAAAPNMARVSARRREWNTGVAAMLDSAWADWGLLPKAPLRLYGEYESTLPQPPLPMGSFQQQDPSVAVGRGLGLGLVRQPNPAAVGMDAIRSVNALKGGLKERAAQPVGGAIPGRGPIQGVFGQSKEEDMQDMLDNYNRRKR